MQSATTATVTNTTATPSTPTAIEKATDIVSPNVVKATPGKHLSYAQKFVQKFIAPELSATALKKYGNQIFAEFRALNDWIMVKLCAV